jgi:phage-related protein
MGSIRLFRSTETNFTHNEWVLNEVMNCTVTDGINQDYTVALEYPLEDSKGISSNLVVGAIISVPSIDGRADQLFRIIDKDTSITTITVQAQAKLLADLKENAVRAATLTGLNRKQAITQILNTCLASHPYTAGNLDANTYNGVILNVPEGRALSALIGEENSVLSGYGGV